ncbi:MAG TPA: iron-containing alcohol dehydrogenase, partial [Aggregatilineales bacterium]|nr:iron-containing alcohol dehydrogenase [Aggregatilineales bacterium]
MDIRPLPLVTFRSIGSIAEKRPVALIAPKGDQVSPQIKLPVVVQAEPPHNERELVDMLANNLPSKVRVIYVVAEDPALFNVAKSVATRNLTPLVVVPTALSSDAAFSSAVVVNDQGLPTHVESGTAEEVIIDFDLIRAAPPEIRAVGIVDLLSIVTALIDWNYANQKHKLSPDEKFQEWALKIGSAIALQAIKGAPQVGQGSPEALRELIDLMCLSVQLNNQLGHQRVSHGVEHLFADAFTGPGHYAEKVGAGILLTSALHNKDLAAARGAMEGAGVKLNALAPDDIRATFNALPDFARSHNAPYTVLNDLSANGKELADA